MKKKELLVNISGIIYIFQFSDLFCGTCSPVSAFHFNGVDGFPGGGQTVTPNNGRNKKVEILIKNLFSYC